MRPDVVHYHNLHNLGLSLVDETFARGIRSFFTPHNLWLVSARNHLMREGGVLCDGPRRGRRQLRAVRGVPRRRRLPRAAPRDDRARAGRVGQVQAVSGFVRDMLVDGGLPAEMVSVLPLGAPSAAAIWEAVGRDRGPRDRSQPLVIGFVGAGVWHKGVFQFASAAAAVTGDVPVRAARRDQRCRPRPARAASTRPAASSWPAPTRTPTCRPCCRASTSRCVPSAVWEGAPLTVGEARAARLPVIASRMGGLAEGVRDGVDGLLVDGWSETRWRRRSQRLADRPFLLDALAAAIPAPRTFADYVDDLEAGYAAGAAAHTEPQTPLAVRWRGDFDAISSLARINAEVVRRLGDGFTVDIAADDRPASTTAAPRPRRRRGAPPVAAAVRRPGPRPAGADPALGVRLDPARLDRAAGRRGRGWVPSAFVRDMYVGDGIPADRVHVVPNGVDLATYRPDGPARRLPATTSACSCSSAAPSTARASTSCWPRSRRPSRVATTCCWRSRTSAPARSTAA